MSRRKPHLPSIALRNAERDLQAGLRACEWGIPTPAPSRAMCLRQFAQWRDAGALLAYRCGGSAGIVLI